MIDTTVNLPTIVAIVLATIGGIVWLIRMEGRVNETSVDMAALHGTVQALRALVELHKQQFHDYQMASAEKYMTQAAFAEIKRELVSEINRMEVRLEAQIARIGDNSTSGRNTGQS